MSAVKYVIGAAAAGGLIYLLTKRSTTTTSGGGTNTGTGGTDTGNVITDPSGTIVVELPTSLSDQLAQLTQHGTTNTPVVISTPGGNHTSLDPNAVTSIPASVGYRSRHRIGLVQKCECAKGGTCQTTDWTCGCCDSAKVALPAMPRTITSRPLTTRVGLVQKCECAKGGTCQTTDWTCGCCDSAKTTLPLTTIPLNPSRVITNSFNAYAGRGL